MSKLRVIVGVLFFCFAASVFAWDSNGHRLVGEIAYEHLTPSVQKAVLSDLDIPGPYYRHPLSFSNAAAWADWIRDETSQYDAWHYINLAYCEKKPCAAAAIKKPNLVWALEYEANILSHTKSSSKDRAQALRFYLHWIGDIHQPMHAINFYSPDYPKGDAGGNFFLLNDPQYSNLHTFWDQGCGLWPVEHKLSKTELKRLASNWQYTYPMSAFKTQLKDRNANHWAQDSHDLAISYGYDLFFDHQISASREKKAQTVCKKQIVLAGYRLAENLNFWYSSPRDGL